MVSWVYVYKGSTSLALIQGALCFAELLTWSPVLYPFSCQLLNFLTFILHSLMLEHTHIWSNMLHFYLVSSCLHFFCKYVFVSCPIVYFLQNYNCTAYADAILTKCVHFIIEGIELSLIFFWKLCFHWYSSPIL